MEHKKELTKIALAAFILASTTTVNAEDQIFETTGTYLAAGCKQHGCQTIADATGSPSSYQMESRPMVTRMSTTLTDAQLLGMLNDQGRKIFMSLDAEGKALAVQLASQDLYKDKNLAVKEAQRRMSEKQTK